MEEAVQFLLRYGYWELRNVINRRNVITDVSKDLTACEEFMQLATIAHVMSAAIHIANMSELSSKDYVN